MTEVLGIALGTQLVITSAGAQAPLPGDRVRVTIAADGGSKVTGTLVELRADTMVLQRDDAKTAPIPITASQVQSLELSVGTRTLGKKGATIGALVGATIGAVWGFAVGDTTPDCPPGAEPGCEFAGLKRLDDRSHTTVFGAAIGATAGFTIGGLIGLASTTDRWLLLNAGDQPVKLTIGPAGSAGIRAALAYGFGAAARR